MPKAEPKIDWDGQEGILAETGESVWKVARTLAAYDRAEDSRTTLEKLGFRVLNPKPKDEYDIHYHVVPPKGYTIRRDRLEDHPGGYCLEILNENGEEILYEQGLANWRSGFRVAEILRCSKPDEKPTA